MSESIVQPVEQPEQTAIQLALMLEQSKQLAEEQQANEAGNSGLFGWLFGCGICSKPTPSRVAVQPTQGQAPLLQQVSATAPFVQQSQPFVQQGGLYQPAVAAPTMENVQQIPVPASAQ